jgi:hypothetical protein
MNWLRQPKPRELRAELRGSPAIRIGDRNNKSLLSELACDHPTQTTSPTRYDCDFGFHTVVLAGAADMCASRLARTNDALIRTRIGRSQRA